MKDQLRDAHDEYHADMAETYACILFNAELIELENIVKSMPENIHRSILNEFFYIKILEHVAKLCYESNDKYFSTNIFYNIIQTIGKTSLDNISYFYKNTTNELLKKYINALMDIEVYIEERRIMGLSGRSFMSY